MTGGREFLLEVDGRRTRISWKRRRAGGTDQAKRNKEQADEDEAQAKHKEKVAEQGEQENEGEDEEGEEDDADAEAGEDVVKKDTGIVVVVLPSRILEASRIPQD